MKRIISAAIILAVVLSLAGSSFAEGIDWESRRMGGMKMEVKDWDEAPYSYYKERNPDLLKEKRDGGLYPSYVYTITIPTEREFCSEANYEDSPTMTESVDLTFFVTVNEEPAEDLDERDLEDIIFPYLLMDIEDLEIEYYNGFFYIDQSEKLAQTKKELLELFQGYKLQTFLVETYIDRAFNEEFEDVRYGYSTAIFDEATGIVCSPLTNAARSAASKLSKGVNGETIYVFNQNLATFYESDENPTEEYAYFFRAESDYYNRVSSNNAFNRSYLLNNTGVYAINLYVALVPENYNSLTLGLVPTSIEVFNQEHIYREDLSADSVELLECPAFNSSNFYMFNYRENWELLHN